MKRHQQPEAASDSWQRELGGKIRTVTERNRLIAELDAHHHPRQHLAEPARTLLQHYQADASGKAMSALRQDVISLPTIDLTIAITPTPPLIEQIYAWLTPRVPHAFLLACTSNPKIGGGLIISIDGRWGDYSLQSRLTSSLPADVVP